MRTFVQFKDGIAFAYVQTEGEAAGVEVFVDNPDDLMGCSLDKNNLWVEAQTIKYAIVNNAGQIVETRETKFPSEVKENPVLEKDTDLQAIWNGTKFVSPVVELPSE
jgi:hypothetical protein